MVTETSQKHPRVNTAPALTSQQSLTYENGVTRPRPQRHKTPVTADEYFTGPADVEHHSRFPYFLRMHGSITPRMILPLAFIALWSTLITLISHFWYPLKVDSLLLTVLGFVVGLGISFRTSSAYERYVDGRRFWAQLSQSSRDLARHVWIHAEERHDKDAATGKADLLAKISALNMIVAFAVALKHKLRFEPYTNHEDLQSLVAHLHTFAGEASDHQIAVPPKVSSWKRGGEYLDVSFAESNPRKQVKRATRNLGNLPLEILTYLSAYANSICKNGTLDPGVPQSMILANLASLNEVLAGTERVLNTPLPIAYSIAISQITWVYVLMLPFQLWNALHWLTIPGTIIGAYIILGIAAIGREIENPFGNDVNDLPLESFCKGLADEINVIMARPPPKVGDFVQSEKNVVLQARGYDVWMHGNLEAIRDALAANAKRASEGDINEKVHERLATKVMRHVPV